MYLKEYKIVILLSESCSACAVEETWLQCHITCAWNSKFTDKYWKFLSVTDLCLFCLGLKEQLVFSKDVETLTWG